MHDFPRLVALAVFICGKCAWAAESPVWDPERTWVFAVGVLQFDRPGLATWPEKGRVDAVLIETLRKRGVPDDHVVSLKNEAATAAAITRRFPELLQRTGRGDTLFVY